MNHTHGKLTSKQEKFCLSYIETGNASEAYRQAYHTENMKPVTINRKAKELLENGKITARVEELQSAHRDRHNITVDNLTDELEEARLLAMKKENPSAAVSACIGKARLHGVLIKETSTPIKIRNLTGTLTEQGQRIVTAMGNGEVTPTDASSMLQALAAQARIIEIDELEKRIRKLEGKHGA